MSVEMKIERMHEALAGEISEDACANLFEEVPWGKWQDRFRIYSQGYWARCRLAMESTYPVLSKLLGEQRWSEWGSQYIQEYFRLNTNLNNIGDRFSEFLKARDHPREFVDLADFEWKIQRAFDSDAMESNISIDDLSSINENSSFDFQPYVFILSYQTTTAEAWLNRESGRNRSQFLKEFSIIYRLQYNVECRLLTADEFKALENLRTGQSLGHAIASLDVDEHLLLVWLQGWFKSGIIARIKS